ncbi:MAG: hypothetical protein CMO26_17845 [Thiotrichales bacterium]|nr:hypothetical protein [Thiotrichales bacterium]
MPPAAALLRRLSCFIVEGPKQLRWDASVKIGRVAAQVRLSGQSRLRLSCALWHPERLFLIVLCQMVISRRYRFVGRL